MSGLYNPWHSMAYRIHVLFVIRYSGSNETRSPSLTVIIDFVSSQILVFILCLFLM